MLVVRIAAPFSVSTSRRVCADTACPLRRGPPRREGPGRSVVSVRRPAAWGRHPRPRLPAAWRALIRRYRLFLPYRRAPPDQCFGVLRCSGGTIRSSAAAVPARSVLSFGLLSAAVGRRGF